MPLREEFESSGNWLFKNRSWIPLTLYPLAFLIIYFYRDETYRMITDTSWSLICLSISALGLFVRILTIGYVPKGTSGRNTASQKACTLNHSGIYSITRHPLYLGNFLMWAGLLVYVGVWWFTAISSLLYWLYYERIMFAEEEFLRNTYRDAYLEWAKKTPAFFPKFSLWQPTTLSFSLKNVLKREYNGFMVCLLSFSSLNLAANWLHLHTFYLNPIWQYLLFPGTFVYLILRSLKKYTHLLNVEGR